MIASLSTVVEGFPLRSNEPYCVIASSVIPGTPGGGPVPNFGDMTAVRFFDMFLNTGYSLNK